MAGYNLGTARGLVDIDTKGLKDADLTLREAGRGLLYTGGALVGAFGYVVKTAADFEKELDYVQAITQSTAAEMEALSAVAIDLGKKGPFGPKEVAASFVELAKAGVGAQDIVDGVAEASINLASAADIPLVDSTEILVNTLKTFNLEAKDAVATVDTIAGAANASTIDVEDFAFSMRYAGSIASALGVPLDDLATALAIVGDRGIKGSTGGTSLRRVLLELASPSKAATKQLKELGLVTEDGASKFFDAAGTLKPLPEIFELLNEATAGLDQQALVSFYDTLFGARAAPSALILAGVGAEGFAEYAATIDSVAAGDVAAARLDNLSGAVLRLKAAIEATFITAGTPFQKVLQEMVEFVTKLVVAFSNLPPGLQSFILGSIGALGVLSLMAGAFLLTIGNIVRTIRVIGELGNAFRAINAIGSAGAGGVGLFGRALAFLISPIGLVVIAVVAAIAAFIYFYKTNEKFRDFINGIGDDIVKIWGKVVDFFERLPEILSGAFDSAKEAVSTFFSGFDITKPLDGLKLAWTAFWESGFGGEGITTAKNKLVGILERMGVQFFQIWTSIKDTVTGAIDTVVDKVTGFGSAIKDAFVGAYNAVVDFVTGLPGMIASGLQSAFTAYIDFLSKLPERAGFFLGFVVGRFLRFILDSKALLHQWVNTSINAIVNFGKRLIVETAIFLFSTFQSIKQWAIDTAQSAFEMGLNFITNVVSWLSQLPGRVATFLLETLISLINFIPQFTSSAFQLGLGVFTSIVNWLLQLPGKILEFLLQMLAHIVNFISSMGSAAKDLGQAVFNGFIDIITGIPGKIRDIIAEALNIFTNAVGTGYNAAKSFGDGLWRGFKAGMGMNSPSFIEKALMAVEGQAYVTADNLNSAVRGINASAGRLPDVSTAAPVASASINGSIPYSPAVGNDRAGFQYNQNAPLIGQATIRSDDDIVKLARQLNKEQDRRARARGVTVSGRI